MIGQVSRRTHLGPSSEGDDEGEEERLLLGYSRQIGGGLAGVVIPGTDFAHQPAAGDNNKNNIIIHIVVMEKY